MTGDLAVVILAAGRSTRFKSATTKVLHELAGRPLLEWTLHAVAGLQPSQCIIVHGTHNGEELQGRLGNRFSGLPLSYILQDPPQGTGHALLQAETALGAGISHLIVLPGDAPLLEADDLRSLQQALLATAAEHAVLTATLEDPTGYGRVIRDPADSARITRIVEHSDASQQELTIGEINSGMYLFGRNVFDQLRQAANDLGASASQGEYYLPDAVRYGMTTAVRVNDPLRIAGINDRVQLAAMESIVQRRLRERWMRAGVTFVLPETSFLHADVEIGMDSVIGPNCILTKATRIADGTILEAGCMLETCDIGPNCRLLHVRGQLASLGASITVGPYVNLRPGTELADGVKVGNFVEIKQAKVGPGSKLPHLSYVGNAEIGAHVNIGAGTIFCNYDGVSKQTTRIGDNVFVGSNSSLQAPLEIGAGAYIGMASAITKDVPPDTLAIGRARQENKPGYAARLREQQSRRKKDKSAAQHDAGTGGEGA